MIYDLMIGSLITAAVFAVAGVLWALGSANLRFGRSLPFRPSVIILVAVMLSAGALSTYRVYSVPILQCPDEDSHLDYAFSLYSAGRLLDARHPPSSGWNVKYVAESWDWERISHIYTLYLSRAVNMRAVRISEANKEPATYGTAAFYKTIDSNAPRSPVDSSGLTTKDNPWLMVGYPAGYYVLSAIEMKVIDHFTNSLTDLFFSVRLMSVVLLMIDIILAYLVLRKVRARYPLAITSIFAFFPLTTYVSSCVQPDNLALTLVLSTWCVGLSVDGSPRDKVRLPLLALVMGLLLFTKFHFFPFAVIPIVGRLILQRSISYVTAAALFVPASVVIMIQIWIMWGGDLRIATGTGPSQGVFSAIREYYFGGYAYVSYWSSSYGWASIPGPVKVALQIATGCAFGLSLIYLVGSAVRLMRIALRRPRLAAISALNPLVFGHFWFISAMVVLFVLTRNGFYAQGRDFFPFILSGLYLAIEVAPRIFARRRAFASLVAIAFLLLFCAFGGFSAASAVTERYYISKS